MFRFFSTVTALSELCCNEGKPLKDAMVIYKGSNSMLVSNFKVLAVYSREDNTIYVNENYYVATNKNKRTKSYKWLVGAYDVRTLDTKGMNALIEELDQQQIHNKGF